MCLSNQCTPRFFRMLLQGHNFLFKVTQDKFSHMITSISYDDSDEASDALLTFFTELQNGKTLAQAVVCY